MKTYSWMIIVRLLSIYNLGVNKLSALQICALCTYLHVYYEWNYVLNYYLKLFLSYILSIIW